MLAYHEWVTKFPQFVNVSVTLFATLQEEAQVEMGTTVSRWLDQVTYNISMGYLIAHLAALDDSWQSGDHSPMQPFRAKNVDDVLVEYAVTRNAMNNFDSYLSTVYGQQYTKWRRIAFGGPRVV